MSNDATNGAGGNAADANQDRKRLTGATIARWLRIAAGVGAAQAGWLVLVWTSSSPWHGAARLVGGLGGAAILLSPHLGVYALAFLLIGQWPGNLMRYLGVVTVLSALAWLLIHQQRLVPRNVIVVLTGAFLLLVVASAVDPQTRVGLSSEVFAYTGNCAVVWLLVALVTSRKMVLNIVRLLVLSGVITASIGLVQWYTHFIWVTSTTQAALEVHGDFYEGKTGFDLQHWRGQFRVDSITGTPDYLPLYMQTLMPFVGLWVVRQQTWSRRLAGAGILLLFGVCHVLSFTRGALVTTAFVLFLVGWVWDPRRCLVYGPIMALMGLAVMMSWEPWHDRLATMFVADPGTEDGAGTGLWRLNVVPTVVSMMLQRPLLGVGIGQGRWCWPESTLGVLIPDPDVIAPMPVHNDYLGVGVDLGVGGMVVLVLMLGVTMSRSAWLARRFRGRGDLPLADVSLGIVIATAGLAAAMFLYPVVGTFRYFWLILGLTGALLRLDREGEQPTPASQ